MAMPSKFTPEIQIKVLSAVMAGAFLATAARRAGISRYTLRDWLESDDPRYAEFQTQILQAQGTAGFAKEREAFETDYKFWLLCGPCRERYNDDGTVAEEGWARPGRPRVAPCKKCAARRDQEPVDFVQLEQGLKAVGVFLSPEQRAALAGHLAQCSPHAPREESGDQHAEREGYDESREAHETSEPVTCTPRAQREESGYHHAERDGYDKSGEANETETSTPPTFAERKLTLAKRPDVGGFERSVPSPREESGFDHAEGDGYIIPPTAPKPPYPGGIGRSQTAVAAKY